jgi:hypothetical protein
MGDLNSKYQETHNNRFDLATLCHDSCEGCDNSKRATHNVAARIAPLNALQVKRMLAGPCGRKWRGNESFKICSKKIDNGYETYKEAITIIFGRIYVL